MMVRWFHSFRAGARGSALRFRPLRALPAVAVVAAVGCGASDESEPADPLPPLGGQTGAETALGCRVLDSGELRDDEVSALGFSASQLLGGLAGSFAGQLQRDGELAVPAVLTIARGQGSAFFQLRESPRSPAGQPSPEPVCPDVLLVPLSLRLASDAEGASGAILNETIEMPVGFQGVASGFGSAPLQSLGSSLDELSLGSNQSALLAALFQVSPEELRLEVGGAISTAEGDAATASNDGDGLSIAGSPISIGEFTAPWTPSSP